MQIKHLELGLSVNLHWRIETCRANQEPRVRATEPETARLIVSFLASPFSLSFLSFFFCFGIFYLVKDDLLTGALETEPDRPLYLYSWGDMWYFSQFEMALLNALFKRLLKSTLLCSSMLCG